jgi:hypothetical protein
MRAFLAVDPPERMRLEMGLIQESLKEEILGAISWSYDFDTLVLGRTALCRVSFYLLAAEISFSRSPDLSSPAATCLSSVLFLMV